MSHAITVFVARAGDHAERFKRAPYLGVVDLGHGFVATPLTDDVLDQIGPGVTVSERLDAAATAMSAEGPIVYLETEYFGGVGGKAAAAYLDGKRAFAAFEGQGAVFLRTDIEAQAPFEIAVQTAFDEISPGESDCFDLLGLDRWRGTDRILDDIRANRTQAPIGVILAGGLARRMGGGDKSLNQLGYDTVLARVISRLEPQVGQILLNANGDPKRFAAFGLPVCADSVAEYPGPLAGVLAGLDAAADLGASSIVTVAADTPFFPQDLVEQLQSAVADAGTDLALAGTPDPERGVIRHPTFGLWPVSLREDLREALNDGVRKVVLWTDRHGAATAVFDIDPMDPFFNINTPDDLARAETLLEAM